MVKVLGSLAVPGQVDYLPGGPASAWDAAPEEAGNSMLIGKVEDVADELDVDGQLHVVALGAAQHQAARKDFLANRGSRGAAVLNDDILHAAIGHSAAVLLPLRQRTPAVLRTWKASVRPLGS